MTNGRTNGKERKEEKESEAERRQTQCSDLPGLTGPAAPPIREAHIYRRSTAVLAKGTRSRPRLSLRPCFLGRGRLCYTGVTRACLSRSPATHLAPRS